MTIRRGTLMSAAAQVGGGGAGDVTPDAIDFNDVSVTGSSATTNSQTITGIDGTITLQVSFTETGSNYLLEAYESTNLVGSGNSPNSFNFNVSSGDSISFDITGTTGEQSTGTVTIRNVSDSNEILDTFTVDLNDAATEITFVGSTSSINSTTISLPTGLQQDDFVLIVAASDNALTPMAPTGYTTIYDERPSSTGAMASYKFMGATPDTQATGLRSDSRAPYVAMAFRGVNTTTPLDVSFTEINTAGSGMPNPPSITTVTDGCMIVAVGHLDDDNITATAPSGYSLGGTRSGTTAGATVMAAYLLQSTAGSIDPGVFGGGGNDQNEARTIALRPAGGGGGGGGGGGSDATPNAVNWNNISDNLAAGETATTNTVQITGIDTIISIEVTLSQAGAQQYFFQARGGVNNTGSAYTLTSGSIGSPGTYTFDVTNNDYITFSVSTFVNNNSGGTATIRNASDGNALLDTINITI